MKLCLFNLTFKLGAYVLQVEKKCDNIYVEKSFDENHLFISNAINYLLEFPSNFTAKDFDLFFTLCYFAKKIKNNSKLVSIDFADMARFLPYKRSYKQKKRFYDEIFDCCVRCSHITSILCERNDSKDFVKPKHFFKSITSDKDGEKVLFQLNDIAFEYLFFFENYFKLNLAEFCSLKSKGAKILLRLLIQYQNLPKKNGIKTLILGIDDFIKILKSNAIESNEPKYIVSKVLEPAVKELVSNKNFNSICYEKLKSKKDIVGYNIFFDDSNRKSDKA